LDEIYQPGNQANTDQATQCQFENSSFGIIFHPVLLFSCSADLDVICLRKLQNCKRY